MPKISRKTTGARKIGVYAGPEPTPGTYRAVVIGLTLVQFGTGTQAFNVGVRLEDNLDGKDQTDGYTGWGRIFLGDNEFQIERENALYRALAGREDVDVVFSDFDSRGRAEIEKLGGKSTKQLLGTKVLARLVLGQEYEGQRKIEVDSVYPLIGADAKAPSTPKAAEPEDDDTLIPDASVTAPAPKVEEPSVVVQEGISEEDEAVDYHALSVPELKAYAGSLGLIKVGPKAKILAALDEHFAAAPSGESAAGWATAKDLEEHTVEEIVKHFESSYGEGDLLVEDYLDEKSSLIDLLVEDEFVTSF